jgi:hypothetical protein
MYGQLPKGYVIKIDGERIYMDLHAPDVNVSDIVSVHTPGEFIIHPVTKKQIRTEGEVIGTVEITQVYESYSIGKALPGVTGTLKEGLTVRKTEMVKVEEKVAEEVAEVKPVEPPVEEPAIDDKTATDSVRNPQVIQPVLRGKEMLVNMQKEYPALYQQYKSGDRQVKQGYIVFASGALLTAGGIIGIYLDYKVWSDISLGATIVGGACMTAGVPLYIIGNVKKGKASRQYEKNISGNTTSDTPYFQLNMHGHGLGLAYVF